MYKIHDYRCDNTDCELYHQAIEKMHKDSDVIVCEHCKMEMTRLVSAPRTKHISWSTWRIGMAD